MAMQAPGAVGSCVFAFIIFSDLCVETHCYKCPEDLPTLCYKGYNYVPDKWGIPHCGDLYRNTSHGIGWSNAREMCGESNDRLIEADRTPNSIEMNGYGHDANAFQGKVWIGLAVKKGRNITWADHTQLQLGAFHSFSKHPSQIDGSQHCGYAASKMGTRISDDCKKKYTFVCHGRPGGEPKRPRLIMDFNTIEDASLTEGKAWTSSCTAHLNGVGFLQFVLIYVNNDEITENVSQMTYTDEYDPQRKRYHETEVYKGKVCSSPAYVSIKLSLSLAMGSSKLSCTSHTRNKVPICPAEDVYCSVAGDVAVVKAEQPFDDFSECLRPAESLIIIATGVLAISASVVAVWWITSGPPPSAIMDYLNGTSTTTASSSEQSDQYDSIYLPGAAINLPDSSSSKRDRNKRKGSSVAYYSPENGSALTTHASQIPSSPRPFTVRRSKHYRMNN